MKRLSAFLNLRNMSIFPSSSKYNAAYNSNVHL